MISAMDATKDTGGAWSRGPTASASTSGSALQVSDAFKTNMHNRLLFAVLNSIGMSVTVHVKNGAIYEGILHTCRPETAFGVVLRHAIQVKSADGVTQAPGEYPTFDGLVIYQEDFVMMTVKNADLGFAEVASDTFRTDAEISGGEIREKELQRWVPSDHDALHGLEDDQSLLSHEPFDQFAGKDSTFDESLYTTELDKSEFDKAAHDRAARIADAIMKGDTSNVHVAEERGLSVQKDYDEEELYGAVIRDNNSNNNSNRYIPPSARSKIQQQQHEAARVPNGAAPESDTNSTPSPATTASNEPPKMSFAQAMRSGAAPKAAATKPVSPTEPTKSASPQLANNRAAENEKEQSLDTHSQAQPQITAEETQHTAAGVDGEKTLAEPQLEDQKKKNISEDAATDVKEAQSDEKKDAASKTDEATDTASTDEKKEDKSSFKFNPNAKEFVMNVNAKPFVPTFAKPPPPAPEHHQQQQHHHHQQQYGDYQKGRGDYPPYGRGPKGGPPMMDGEQHGSPTFGVPNYPGMMPGQPMHYGGYMPSQFGPAPMYMPQQKMYAAGPMFMPGAGQGRMYPPQGVPGFEGGVPMMAMPPGMYGQPPGGFAYMMPGMEMEGDMMPPQGPLHGRRGGGGGERGSPKLPQNPHMRNSPKPHLPQRQSSRSSGGAPPSAPPAAPPASTTSPHPQ